MKRVKYDVIVPVSYVERSGNNRRIAICFQGYPLFSHGYRNSHHVVYM